MESKVELLVPVKTWDALNVVIEAGADAVDLGNQSFIFKSDGVRTELDPKELQRAVTYAHARQVKLYVAVNNLLSDEELIRVAEYLAIFEEQGVDGVRIRDLALLNLVQKMEPSFAVHAAHEMMVCNVEAIRYVQDRGVSRVEMAPGFSVQQIAQYSQQVDLELTYLIHEGLWQNQSDQALHSRIKDLLHIGITSLMVEPETEDHGALRQLVTQYRQILDDSVMIESVADVTETDEGVRVTNSDLERNFDQHRELSVAWAFGDPWVEMEQLGQFVSWGQNPSETVPQLAITDEHTMELKKQLLHGLDGTEEKVSVKVTVAVPTFDHFLAVLQGGAERILIDGDSYLPGQSWSYEEIAMAIRLGYEYNCEVVYRTQGLMGEEEMANLKEFFEIFRPYHLRVMTGDLGVIEAIYGADLSFTLFGDVGLDAFNSQTFHYLKRQGYDSVILSPKSGVKEVCLVGRNRIIEVEMLAQGLVPGMRSEAHLALLPILGELARNGISNFRIEGAFYAPEDLVEILKLYRRVIRFDYDAEVIQEGLARLQEICPTPLTYGALANSVLAEQPLWVKHSA